MKMQLEYQHEKTFKDDVDHIWKLIIHYYAKSTVDLPIRHTECKDDVRLNRNQIAKKVQSLIVIIKKSRYICNGKMRKSNTTLLILL